MRELKSNRKIRYIVLPSYCQSGVTDSVIGREQEEDGVRERWEKTREKKRKKHKIKFASNAHEIRQRKTKTKRRDIYTW